MGSPMWSSLCWVDNVLPLVKRIGFGFKNGNNFELQTLYEWNQRYSLRQGSPMTNLSQKRTVATKESPCPWCSAVLEPGLELARRFRTVVLCTTLFSHCCAVQGWPQARAVDSEKHCTVVLEELRDFGCVEILHTFVLLLLSMV